MVHELGHGAFFLDDLYAIDQSGYSGIGSFGVMSSGSWGATNTDSYAGETPTNFSAYSKIVISNFIHYYSYYDNAYTNMLTFGDQYTVYDTGATVHELSCAHDDHTIAAIPTADQNELFLVECRDYSTNTGINYDTGLWIDDNSVLGQSHIVLYHVDMTQTNQNDNTRYMVEVVEKTGNEFNTNTNYGGLFNDGFTSSDYINDSGVNNSNTDNTMQLNTGSTTGISLNVNSVNPENASITITQ
jgi:M6 family metalloprotease-like protein